MKERLLILTDLWGQRKAGYLHHYLDVLKRRYKVVLYDSCVLGGIDLSDYSQENLHRQFVDGGIERAVQQLLEKEKQPCSILGFSIGGVIAWQAALGGLKVNRLITISSTRLRYESVIPDADVKLFFGAKDKYRPDQEWANNLKVDLIIRKGVGHELYTIPGEAEVVTEELMKR